MKSYKKFEELEELDKIRAYDDAKARDDEVIPLEQTVKEIEKAAAITILCKKP